MDGSSEIKVNPFDFLLSFPTPIHLRPALAILAKQRRISDQGVRLGLCRDIVGSVLLLVGLMREGN